MVLIHTDQRDLSDTAGELVVGCYSYFMTLGAAGWRGGAMAVGHNAFGSANNLPIFSLVVAL